MADLQELRSRLSAVVREFLAEEGLRPRPSKSEPDSGQALFSTLEDAAVEIGDAVTREVLEQELAAGQEPEPKCPCCGAAGMHVKERPRSIQTRRGLVKMAEAECYCRRCRRSFFPSVPGVGPGCGL